MHPTAGGAVCGDSKRLCAFRRHIQDAAAVAPANMLAAEGGVAALVRSHVPQASVLTRCADEVSFRLPRASVTEFPNLLRGLEVRCSSIGTSQWLAHECAQLRRSLSCTNTRCACCVHLGGVVADLAEL